MAKKEKALRGEIIERREEAEVRPFDPAKGIDAFDPDSAEKYMIAISYNEAARQIKSGTASASTINHFLKLGSERERIERENLLNQTKLSKAKADKLDADGEQQADAHRAIEALKNYSPSNE